MKSTQLVEVEWIKTERFDGEYGNFLTVFAKFPNLYTSVFVFNGTFNDWGLSRPGFKHQNYGMLGERSNWTPRFLSL